MCTCTYNNNLKIIVQVRQQATNGWWEGELQSRGKQKSTGWFPANRVEVLTRQHNTSSTSSLSGNLRVSRSKSVSQVNVTVRILGYI